MSKRTWEQYEKQCAAKRRGEKKPKVSAPQSIMIQRMTAEANRLKKYEPLDTRDFVDFSAYNELSIENIKEACEKYYEMPTGSCDILLGDRGPSCYLNEQISCKKVYFVRFVDVADKIKKTKTGNARMSLDLANNNVASASFTRNYNIKTSCHKPVPSYAFPKSVCVADLLHAAKLVKPPDVTQMTLILESYDVSSKQWNIEKNLSVLKENTRFAEGGFRNAFLATSLDGVTSTKWVVKEAKEEMMRNVTLSLNVTADAHTRKQVQMNAVARSVSMAFAQKAPYNFGKRFHYQKVYFSMIGEIPVTVVEFIPGTFAKYINNNGNIIENESEEHIILINKAECFVHFSYDFTNEQIMILDLQGVAYNLCDPEIATTDLLQDGELKFCAGNLSTTAIGNFFASHKCNKYCKMMQLEEEGEQ